MGDYWEDRYRQGGHSGNGSLGVEGERKGRLVNEAIAVWQITSLLDIGSGDGNQALHYQLGDCLYLGIDPSRTARKLARLKRPDLRFAAPSGDLLPMDAHMSMDVLQHLTTEKTYADHLALLFSARRVALVYGTNHDEEGNPWVLHREWTPDVPAEWSLAEEWQVTPDKYFWVFHR